MSDDSLEQRAFDIYQDLARDAAGEPEMVECETFEDVAFLHYRQALALLQLPLTGDLAFRPERLARVAFSRAKRDEEPEPADAECN